MGKILLFEINFSKPKFLAAVIGVLSFLNAENSFSQNQPSPSSKSVQGAQHAPAKSNITVGKSSGPTPSVNTPAPGQQSTPGSAAPAVGVKSQAGVVQQPANSCTSPGLEKLTFMGRAFDRTNAICIRGVTTDSKAIGSLNMGRAVNPGNPQYGKEAGPGNQDSNSVGYYFIVADFPDNRNRKNWMCLNPDWNSFLQNIQLPIPQDVNPGALGSYISTVWNTKGNYGDGSCDCIVRGANNSQQRYTDCAKPDVANTALQATFEAARSATPAQPTTPVAGSPATSSDPTGATVAATANSQFASCIEQALNAGRSCRSKADNAKATCERVDRETAGSKAMQDVLGAGGEAATMLNAGQGVQQQCFKASVMAMGARELIRGMAADCNGPVQECSDSCKDDKYRETVDACARMINKSIRDLENESDTSAEAILYREKQNRISDDFEYGFNICGRELRQESDKMSNLLNGVGTALQSSLRCVCQTSTTSSMSGQNCQNIPNPDNCAMNPGLQGCDVYGSLNNCVPGSPAYDARTCSCLQNPAGAGCTGSGNTPTVTLFGGNLRTAPTGGFAGGGIGGGGGGGGSRAAGLDLSGGGSDEVIQAELRKGSLSGGGGGGVGGGGGAAMGGGGGGGAGGEEGAAAAPPEETGIKGLFNHAKNAVMSAFGKNNANARNTRAGAGGEDDAKGRRKKIRGIASKDIGTRNMDIWKMVNMCANGETCVSNRNNYMENP